MSVENVLKSIQENNIEWVDFRFVDLLVVHITFRYQLRLLMQTRS